MNESSVTGGRVLVPCRLKARLTLLAAHTTALSIVMVVSKNTVDVAYSRHAVN
jgi:hypothetical protein